MGRGRTLALILPAVALAAVGGAALIGACSTPGIFSKQTGTAASANPACPARLQAPVALPGVRPEQRTAAYWLKQAPDADAELLDATEIGSHNTALAARDAAHPGEDPLAPYDLEAPEDPARLSKELHDRMAFLAERATNGSYLDDKGQKLSADPFALPATLPDGAGATTREALADIPLRCGPRPGVLYQGPTIDTRFDRNACSTIRAHEPVRVIARWGTMQLARSRHALGFIDAAAQLSDPLTPERVRALSQRAPRPLTRRAVVTEAFKYLDSPYGWGDAGGGRDCSRFLLDVFGSFGIDLPRHSSLQALAGSMSIDTSKLTSDTDKLALIDAAQERGVVLLHFPGHIMLYLGRSAEGTPMVIHAFAEYLETCQPDGETLRAVDRIQVSDLSLGKGTSRRSFLERISRITVLGRTPGDKLMGVVERRAPAPPPAPGKDCAESDEVAIFTSPRKPHPGQPLRVIVAAAHDLGSAAIALTDPTGAQHLPEVHALGGPPFGYWAEVPAPAAGRWTAQIGDGASVHGCSRVVVNERGDRRQANGAEVWRPRLAWTAATDNLWSLFVEQLFAYPFDDRTWKNLHDLLGDPEKNILFNHLGQNEDAEVPLEPDCADLPYQLRAYFAWKMRLPFAFRRCNRGIGGKAPTCDRELFDSLVGVKAPNEIAAFALFARDNVANGVHSGNGRAEVKSDDSDFVPIELTREAIRPGVVYADPYGHSFVIAGWLPQGVGSHGALLGADAQPDGTIGRRRFWPGSFLFSPNTDEAGSGFKVFRPLTFRGGRTRGVPNAKVPHYSLEQYAGSAQDFYDKVEALINPRPLDVHGMLDALVTALHDQVRARVLSVQNGIDYLARRPAVIDMPRGHAIFETTGAWEDYATPARDMRMLIAIDTVMGFPAAVGRNPARFGVSASAELDAALQQELDKALAARTVKYVATDGRTVEISLKEIVARAAGFEVAYNPNDCVEARWAAPQDSAEAASCNRHAPGNQLALMAQYRPWFHDRKRPPR